MYVASKTKMNTKITFKNWPNHGNIGISFLFWRARQCKEKKKVVQVHNAPGKKSQHILPDIKVTHNRWEHKIKTWKIIQIGTFVIIKRRVLITNAKKEKNRMQVKKDANIFITPPLYLSLSLYYYYCYSKYSQFPI